MRRYLCLLPVVMFLLSGCGGTRGERTVTGAGIGAGAGAVVGAITGLGADNGALLGAAVGGIAGMVTDKSDVNLGDPAWKQGKDSQESNPQQQNSQTAVQSSTASANPAASIANAPPANAGDPESAAPQQSANGPDSETIRAIQNGLSKLGFDPGPANGVAGTKTKSAIRAFQQQNGMPADGEATPQLAQTIQQKVANSGLN